MHHHCCWLNAVAPINDIANETIRIARLESFRQSHQNRILMVETLSFPAKLAAPGGWENRTRARPVSPEIAVEERGAHLLKCSWAVRFRPVCALHKEENIIHFLNQTNKN